MQRLPHRPGSPAMGDLPGVAARHRLPDRWRFMELGGRSGDPGGEGLPGPDVCPATSAASARLGRHMTWAIALPGFCSRRSANAGLIGRTTLYSYNLFSFNST